NLRVKIMTPEQRLEATVHFEQTDRPWRLETIGFWDETLRRWVREGMPRAAAAHPVAPYLYFQFDPLIPLPVSGADNPGFFPKFTRRTLKRDGRYRIIRDETGCTIKVFTSGKSSIPEFLNFPVKDMNEFQRVKRRLNPHTHGRIDNPLFNFLIAVARNFRMPLGIALCGLFGMCRHLLGFERLMIAYYEQPDLIHAIGEQWAILSKGVVSRIARAAKPRFIQFWEDMCYRAGPMISPQTFHTFIAPHYRDVINHARNEGLTSFWLDTDGDCSLLIEPFIEVGINVMYPFEVQAGMDILEVRREYGARLAIMGGIDKRALAGSRQDIESEVFEKVPEMLKSGGYIPSLDHGVPPDVSFSNFKYFLRLLRKKIPRYLINS
ncbi:MAG: uroporphyrinogen decarboxylase family protein, partial [bacterium]